MEYACGHFLFFDFSVFNQKRKNRKLIPSLLKARYFSKSFVCTFKIKTVYLTRSMTSIQFVKIWKRNKK